MSTMDEPPRYAGTAALAWIDAALATIGLTRTGPVTPRIRPWSVTFRVPTDGEPFWFKHNAPGGGYEAALSEALGRWTPESALVPLAVDADRAWTLLPDGGPTLRDRIDREDARRCWQELLRAYAAFQLALVDRVDDLLALGVPDLRPAALPGVLDRLLDEPMIGAALGDELAALRRLRPAFAGWCDEVAGSGVPASLDHSDLHDANVLPRNGSFAFYDWGDAAVAHPFTSLLVASRVAALRFGADADLGWLRDAYLEPWRRYGGAARLRPAVALAARVGPVGRALTWWRMFPGTGGEVRREHAGNVAEWLRELLISFG
jgi:hypothetical protein